MILAITTSEGGRKDVRQQGCGWLLVCHIQPRP